MIFSKRGMQSVEWLDLSKVIPRALLAGYEPVSMLIEKKELEQNMGELYKCRSHIPLGGCYWDGCGDSHI